MSMYFLGGTTAPRRIASRKSDTCHERLVGFGREIPGYAVGRSKSSSKLQTKNDRTVSGEYRKSKTIVKSNSIYMNAISFFFFFLQTSVQALEEEGNAEKHQLAAMHQQRVLAHINQRKREAMTCYTQALTEQIPNVCVCVQMQSMDRTLFFSVLNFHFLGSSC